MYYKKKIPNKNCELAKKAWVKKRNITNNRKITHLFLYYLIRINLSLRDQYQHPKSRKRCKYGDSWIDSCSNKAKGKKIIQIIKETDMTYLSLYCSTRIDSRSRDRCQHPQMIEKNQWGAFS
jgi:hypothetical protein